MSEYCRPASLNEALEQRQSHPDYTVLAGCTDWMVGALERHGPPGVIDIFDLAELKGICSDDDNIVIGAATTYGDVLRSTEVKETLGALWNCVREIGAVQIQERGTLGGNIATSSPVGDTLPVLLALGASIRVASATNQRVIPYHDFCSGYRKTVLQNDELITAIEIPRPAGHASQYWRKVGTRQAQSISKVMVAALADLSEGVIQQCRLAMGAVADRPIRLEAVEALVTGEAPSTELASRAAALARETLEPIDDVRSSRAYRLHVAGSLTQRWIEELVTAST